MSLTVDEAVNLLSAPPPPEADKPAAPVAAAPEPETAEAAPADDFDPLEAELEAEPLADDAAPVPGEPAPAHWAAEDAAIWNSLPPEAQKTVARQEAARQQQVQAVQAEAMRNQQALIELARAVDERVPAIVNQYTQRWHEWTPQVWARLANEDTHEYTRLKAQHDAEYAEAITAQEARDGLAQMEQQAFLAQQSSLLAQAAPDLADPQKGAERIQGVAKFLITEGIPQDVLPRISAAEWGLAYDAMRYRQLAKRAAERKAPAAAAPARAVPPASSAAPSPARTRQGLEAKLTKSGSIDDAVALLVARNRK